MVRSIPLSCTCAEQESSLRKTIASLPARARCLAFEHLSPRQSAPRNGEGARCDDERPTLKWPSVRKEKPMKETIYACAGITLAGLLVSLAVWNHVPDPMPIHWDASGN